MVRLRALPLVTMAVVLVSCGGSDASLERDVRTALILDDVTLPLKLTATVERGNVRLAGVVRTRVQYDRALAVAREVVGAEHVVNEIRLDEHPLATAVYTAMQQDPLVAEVALEIDGLGQGVVVLRSRQTNEEQRTRILTIARSVPGVARVDDYMK